MTSPLLDPKMSSQHSSENATNHMFENIPPLHDSQRYRDCTINGISGVWEADDIRRLLKTSGHNLLCHRLWYSPITKCVGDFQFLRHGSSYITQNSKWELNVHYQGIMFLLISAEIAQIVQLFWIIYPAPQ